jgi:predicted esterase
MSLRTTQAIQMSFVEEEWPLGDGIAYVRIPESLAAQPALLIHLTLTAAQGLEQDPFAIVPRSFLAAGHCVASFDLPNHGRMVDGYGEGLAGMAAAFAAGCDVFLPAVTTGAVLIDAYRQRISPSGPVLASGVSRGGLVALHLAATDSRIEAAAAFAPVTDLRALHEFDSLADAPIVDDASARALAPRLATRPILLTINQTDDRVSTGACVEFFDALKGSAPRDDLHALWIDPGTGHSVADTTYIAGAKWLLDRAQAPVS